MSFRERIIETADEYHLTAEEQWMQASELKPVNDEEEFEFRRLINVAMRFYTRAFLVLGMVETDDDQELDDLLEIACEELPELAEVVEQNDVQSTLSEESDATISRAFSVAEVLRNILLQQSNQRAAQLLSE